MSPALRPFLAAGGATPAISIANAAADGSTKGAAAFTAADFDASAGVISIDYTNGQKATTSVPGFLTAADWTTFNGKAPLASPTFTGTVTLPSGSVTSSAWDTGTSTLTSNGVAFTAKAPLASPSFTGTPLFSSATGVTMGGTLFTLGTNTTFGAEAGQNSRFEFRTTSGGRLSFVENAQQVVTMTAESANWGAFAASREWTMQWQMGKGTSHYGKGRVRGYGSSTQTGNPADATEDDLLSKTLQANLCNNNDEDVLITAWGTTGATANTKTIKLYFGGTAIGTISTVVLSKVWKIDAVVSRTGSSAQKYVVQMDIDGLRTIVSGTLAVSNTATIIVKITGQSSGSALNDVLNEALRVDYDRAGN